MATNDHSVLKRKKNWDDIQEYVSRLQQYKINKISHEPDAVAVVKYVLEYIDIVMDVCSDISPTRKRILHIYQSLKEVEEVINNSKNSYILKPKFLSYATEHVFDAYLDDNYDFWCKRRMIKMYNSCINGTPKEIRQQVADSLLFHMYRLVDSLSIADSIDLQWTLMETTFRIYSSYITSEKLEYQTFPSAPILDTAIKKISKGNFDSDLRTFLNVYNEMYNGKSSKIFSILCRFVTLGDNLVNPPSGVDEEGALWVDFSLSIGLVSLYYETEDGCWDLIILLSSDVINVTVENQILEKESIIIFDYKNTLLTEISDKKTCLESVHKNMKLIISNKNSQLTKLVNHVLPTMFKTCFQPTVPRSVPKLPHEKKSVYKPLKGVFKTSTNRRRSSSAASSCSIAKTISSVSSAQTNKNKYSNLVISDNVSLNTSAITLSLKDAISVSDISSPNKTVGGNASSVHGDVDIMKTPCQDKKSVLQSELQEQIVSSSQSGKRFNFSMEEECASIQEDIEILSGRCSGNTFDYSKIIQKQVTRKSQESREENTESSNYETAKEFMVSEKLAKDKKRTVVKEVTIKKDKNKNKTVTTKISKYVKKKSKKEMPEGVKTSKYFFNEKSPNANRKIESPCENSSFVFERASESTFHSPEKQQKISKLSQDSAYFCQDTIKHTTNELNQKKLSASEHLNVNFDEIKVVDENKETSASKEKYSCSSQEKSQEQNLNLAVHENKTLYEKPLEKEKSFSEEVQLDSAEQFNLQKNLNLSVTSVNLKSSQEVNENNINVKTIEIPKPILENPNNNTAQDIASQNSEIVNSGEPLFASPQNTNIEFDENNDNINKNVQNVAQSQQSNNENTEESENYICTVDLPIFRNELQETQNDDCIEENPLDMDKDNALENTSSRKNEPLNVEHKIDKITQNNEAGLKNTLENVITMLPTASPRQKILGPDNLSQHLRESNVEVQNDKEILKEVQEKELYIDLKRCPIHTESLASLEDEPIKQAKPKESNEAMHKKSNDLFQSEQVAKEISAINEPEENDNLVDANRTQDGIFIKPPEKVQENELYVDFKRGRIYTQSVASLREEPTQKRKPIESSQESQSSVSSIKKLKDLLESELIPSQISAINNPEENNLIDTNSYKFSSQDTDDEIKKMFVATKVTRSPVDKVFQDLVQTYKTTKKDTERKAVQDDDSSSDKSFDKVMTEIVVQADVHVDADIPLENEICAKKIISTQNLEEELVQNDKVQGILNSKNDKNKKQKHRKVKITEPVKEILPKETINILKSTTIKEVSEPILPSKNFELISQIETQSPNEISKIQGSLNQTTSTSFSRKRKRRLLDLDNVDDEEITDSDLTSGIRRVIDPALEFKDVSKFPLCLPSTETKKVEIKKRKSKTPKKETFVRDALLPKKRKNKKEKSKGSSNHTKSTRTGSKGDVDLSLLESFSIFSKKKLSKQDRSNRNETLKILEEGVSSNMKVLFGRKSPRLNDYNKKKGPKHRNRPDFVVRNEPEYDSSDLDDVPLILRKGRKHSTPNPTPVKSNIVMEEVLPKSNRTPIWSQESTANQESSPLPLLEIDNTMPTRVPEIVEYNMEKTNKIRILQDVVIKTRRNSKEEVPRKKQKLVDVTEIEEIMEESRKVVPILQKKLSQEEIESWVEHGTPCYSDNEPVKSTKLMDSLKTIVEELLKKPDLTSFEKITFEKIYDVLNVENL